MVEIQKQNIPENLYSLEQQKEIDKFEKLMDRKKAYEKYPNLKWWYLGDNFFSISKNWDWEIDIFYKDWAPYFNVVQVRKDMEKAWVYEAIFTKAWFKEKLENRVHKMIDKQTWKEIDPLSKEYFEAWQEVMFYEVYRFINYSSVEELKKSKYDTLWMLWIWQDSKCVRIKDLIILLKNMWWGSNSTIKLYLEDYTPEIIKWWITDERFRKVNDIATREEYKEYLDAWYIDEKLYEECMEIFDIRDRKIEEQKNIIETTSKNITKIK